MFVSLSTADMELSTADMELLTAFVASDKDGSVCQHGTNQAQSVDMLLGAVDNYDILGELELVSEFVSDPISEVLIFFLCGVSACILRNVVPYFVTLSVILRGDLF